MQAMLHNIHTQFIESVKQGRGDKLRQDVSGLFSGLIWTGEQSVEIGLVDELASAGYVAREVIGEDNIVDFTVTDDLLDRLAKRVGATTARLLMQNKSLPYLY